MISVGRGMSCRGIVTNIFTNNVRVKLEAAVGDVWQTEKADQPAFHIEIKDYEKDSKKSGRPSSYAND
jgi:hypothetical protein